MKQPKTWGKKLLWGLLIFTLFDLGSGLVFLYLMHIGMLPGM